MLDRGLLLKELDHIANLLFEDDTESYRKAYDIWKKMCTDPMLAQKIASWNAPWPVPTWQNKIDAVHPISAIKQYHIASVDGSQIYPDRHHGISCYLINTGSVSLHYRSNLKPVTFYSKPSVFVSSEDEQDLPISTELVNCKRQELEFIGGIEISKTLQEQIPDSEPFLLLFDGSLIFWHLEAKDTVFRELFLSRYLVALLSLQHTKTLCASYISAPKSREIMNMVKLYACNGDTTKLDTYKALEKLVDSTIMSFVLEEGQRSIVFKNHAAICDQYPNSIRPHFFYINVGIEIGRVEIPAWIAEDETKVDLIASMVLDQSQKGRGYPVAIAEAHEQAVVKGPDRDFFYHVLSKMSIERKRKLGFSQKMIKKRGMGI